MNLRQLPAARQRELNYELDQLQSKYFRLFPPPASRFVVNWVDPNPFVADMASLACEWFPRLALEYASYLHETGDEYSASDLAQAIKPVVMDAMRARCPGGGERFDREYASVVAAALNRCINWFRVNAQTRAQQRIYAAEQRRLAKERAERAARAKPASAEIEALAEMAGVPVPLLEANADASATPPDGGDTVLEVGQSESERKSERKKLRDDYKAECKQNGVKMTHPMIAKAASPTWTTRDPVSKWLALDKRYEGEPDRLIRKVFKDKPHLPKT
jgi:hypothetical protein